ncbi:MAG: hypothetical protein P4L40_24915 [Terracidiphilus sp.]|nr:hypothetical protein [Terracidiphilus sp.]
MGDEVWDDGSRRAEQMARVALEAERARHSAKAGVCVCVCVCVWVCARLCVCV